jgi:hypothetical protein
MAKRSSAIDYFDDNLKMDTLLSFSECYGGDEYIEIFKTAKGSYRVIHSLIGEDPYSGDWERQDHEIICDNGSQAHSFLLETLDTVFGEPPWYITEALEIARSKDEGFGF